MDGFEDMLNSILSSPEQMEKIMGMARSLSGGDGQKPEAEEKTAPDTAADILSGLDPKLLTRLMGLLGKLKAGDSDKAALVASMKPYLRPERREALDKAVKIANIAHIAREAIGEFGGDLNIGL